MSEVIHLGQCLNEDIYKLGGNKFVEDFNQQCNMILLNLNMAIHMIKIFFFINVVQVFMVIKYFHFLTIIWMIFTLHGQ